MAFLPIKLMSRIARIACGNHGLGKRWASAQLPTTNPLPWFPLDGNADADKLPCCDRCQQLTIRKDFTAGEILIINTYLCRKVLPTLVQFPNSFIPCASTTNIKLNLEQMDLQNP